MRRIRSIAGFHVRRLLLLCLFAFAIALVPVAARTSPPVHAAPGDETFTTVAGATAHVWSGTPATLGTDGGPLPPEVSAVFEWSNGSQAFLFWFRGFPVNFNTLPTLNTDGYYFFQAASVVQVTIPGSAGHPLKANQSSFATVPGATGVLWTGAAVAPDTLPAGVSAVFRWNNQGQSFQFYFRGFPANFNTLPPALGPGEFYFLQSSSAQTIQSPTPPVAGSSSALIEASLAAGTLPILPGITAFESALVYKTFASFADPRLPGQFNSATPAFDELALRDASMKYNSASAAAKLLLDPFLLPPSVPGSWIENQPAGAARLSGPRTLVPMTGVTTTLSFFKVWYRNDRPQDAPKAQAIFAEMETVIEPALLGLMGSAHAPEPDTFTGDSRFDIYLVGDLPGTNTAYAELYPSGTCTEAPTFIVAEPMASIEVLKAAVARAYMQAILYTFFDMPCGTVDNWMFFATATWAMDYVYPALGFEHEYAQDFFDILNGGWSLTDSGGAYTWLQFLARRPGGSPTIVRQIWDATTSSGALAATVQALGGQTAFNTLWSEYARHTLNRDPDNFFATLDNLPASTVPSVTSHLAGPATRSYVSKAGQVGLTAHRFTFDPGATVNQLKFGWAPLVGDGAPTARAHAFVKKGGVWAGPENWSSAANRLHVYCSQQVAAERVDELLLVFSTSDVSNSKPAESVLAIQSLVSTEGCPLTIDPPVATVAGGATKQFTAKVNGQPIAGVTWAATGGSITQAGLYTAGATPGTFSVTATRTAPPLDSASASVVIVLPPVLFVSRLGGIIGTAHVPATPSGCLEPVVTNADGVIPNPWTATGAVACTSDVRAASVSATASINETYVQGALTSVTGEGSALASTTGVALFTSSTAVEIDYYLTFTVNPGPVTYTVAVTDVLNPAGAGTLVVRLRKLGDGAHTVFSYGPGSPPQTGLLQGGTYLLEVIGRRIGSPFLVEQPFVFKFSLVFSP